MSEIGTPLTINEDLQQVTPAQFKSLRGRPITISEAADRYDVPGTTLREWVKRYNYIQVLDPGNHPIHLDEADVAYCVAVYQMRRSRGIRAPLFDDRGRPYQLKWPKLSAYRHRKRKVIT